MNSLLNPSSREFFEDLYRDSSDPWNFEKSAYELSRYDAIISALGSRRYSRGFEPGCSVGVLTTRLAKLCDELLATDISETAVMRARERCNNLPNVCVEQGSVSRVQPLPLDLLILSEIGYYFTVSELYRWADDLLANVQGEGVVLAAHWLGSSVDHILSGDQVHRTLSELAVKHDLRLTHSQRTEDFRLDKWTRTQ